MTTRPLSEVILELVEAGFTVTYAPPPGSFALAKVTVSRDVDGRRLERDLAIPHAVRQTMSTDDAMAVDLTIARRDLEEALRAMDR